MNTVQKLRTLSESAKYDTCASSASPRKVTTDDRIGNAARGGICHSFTQDGRCVSLFKVLYSNSCSYDCKYCLNSTRCSKRKNATFRADEFAKVFMSLYVRNYVEGLFLSSGVCRNPDHTTELMIDAVKLIREKYKFQGYIHFKVIPGTSYELIKQASEFSDRMSVNLEAPNKSRLSEISSVKDFKNDILKRQAWLSRMKIPAGQTTQLVVGGSDETDHEILSMTNWEYKNMRLRRGYYSAFVPVKDTPLSKKERTPLLREHRLYNVDFMLRKYGFSYSEFRGIMDNGMLPREDPKVALARTYFDSAVDVNEAGYEELIRVPGIGPQSAQRIIRLRKEGGRVTKKAELRNIGVACNRAVPFLRIDGWRQMRLGEY
jgi:putative DNA modification/repair radical SAM protein